MKLWTPSPFRTLTAARRRPSARPSLPRAVQVRLAMLLSLTTPPSLRPSATPCHRGPSTHQVHAAFAPSPPPHFPASPPRAPPPSRAMHEPDVALVLSLPPPRSLQPSTALLLLLCPLPLPHFPQAHPRGLRHRWPCMHQVRVAIMLSLLHPHSGPPANPPSPRAVH